MSSHNFIEATEARSFPTAMFSLPARYDGMFKSILIPHGLIQDRIEKLAQDIIDSIGSKPITAVCVLKGGHTFFADLVRVVERRNPSGHPVRFDFVRLKSYEGTESTGHIRIIGGDLEALRDRNVLIVEDIVDTGATMVKLLSELEQYSPASVKVASLLVKQTTRSNGYTPDFIGFSIDDAFVVGYGLDYNEHFRDLQHIAVISSAGIEKYK